MRQMNVASNLTNLKSFQENNKTQKLVSICKTHELIIKKKSEFEEPVQKLVE